MNSGNSTQPIWLWSPRGCTSRHWCPGGRLIEQLEKQAGDAEAEKLVVLDRRTKAEKACAGLGLSLPSEAEEYARLAREARLRVENSETAREKREKDKDALKEQARLLG